MKISPSKLLAHLSLLLVCGSLVGCVTPSQMRFSEYTGHDASSALGTWPIGQGSMADTSYVIPVYRGWPERPYQVLGSISFPDPYARWNEDFFSAAAKLAQSHKANAIIVRQGAEFGVSKIAGAKNDPLVISSTYQTTALVIKWLTPQEIRDREILLDELLKRFFVNDAAVAPNRTVGQLVVIYLLQSGLDLRSDELSTRFVETMKRLTNRGSDGLSGDWIYKTAVSVSTVISGGDERSNLGLASVSVDGENVAIVSSGGTVEMNFTGTLSKGRLSGQIGVGGISAKCEGAATPDKISLNFQSLTPDGTVRGNVVLQRLPLKPNDNEKAKPAAAGVGA